MTIFVQSRDSDFGLRVDFAEQGGLDGIPEADQPAVIADLRAMQRDVETHLRKRRDINAQNDTEERKQKEIAADATKTVEKWRAHESNVAKWGGELATVRDAAAAGMIPSPEGLGLIRPKAPERTIGEEIRAALREERLAATLEAMRAAGEHLRVEGDYRSAVLADSDHELQRVIESAGEHRPLVSRETLAWAREIKIARSPLAPTVARLERLHNTYAFLLEMAKQEIAVPPLL